LLLIRLSLFLALFLFAAADRGRAQTLAQSADDSTAAAAAFVYAPNEPQRALKDGKVVHAFRLMGSPPDIDGRLNDEVWMFAETAGDFVQRDPDNGKPMSEVTRIQIAYDERFLYIAVACDDSSPAQIAAGLGRRDEFPSSDYVGLAFDTRHDHLTGYIVETNPSGVQRDYSLSDDDRFDADYNAVWEVRTQMTDRGWTAEFRIPFSQMRFEASPNPGQVWGLNARRQVRRTNELGSWVGKPRGERGEVSLFGHLVFDTPIESPRRVEILPYALARGESRAGDTVEHTGISGGVDLRVGLGQGATLAATVNPDFGQVEQDPAVLNLSVFETFFPEKRPFFLEDSRTFVPNFWVFQLFHSRRIGRAPSQFAVSSDDTVVDKPDETTILGAAKVTGKTGAWTYGGLTALTAREFGIVETNHVRRDHVFEPTTSYNVTRVQRDVMGGSSTVGAIATGVFRDRTNDAFTGGMDYNLRWDDNRTQWNGHWVATRAPGTGGLRTSGGGLTNFNIGHKHWNLGSHYEHFGRDFRINDLGFFRGRVNQNQVNTYGGVEQPDPWKAFRRMWFNGGGGTQWTDDGLPTGRWANVNAGVQFRNYWNVNGGGGRNYQVFDDLDTRGGPPILRPASYWNWFNVWSDSRKSWRWNFGGDRYGSDVGGHGFNAFTGISVQPLTQLQLRMDLRYEQEKNAAQWIKNEDVTADGVNDNVYGTLYRNVVDVTFRGTYSINRDLTLQAYLQPFVAVGDYQEIRRLARAKSYDFEPAVLSSDPDFNKQSLRGNIVLRWEYIRGSTLFVVWDLSQSDTTHPGEFRAFRDLGTAFGADANHVVMVKVSYWLNR
jgi:hypothetical protein